jgi:integrase
MLRHFPCILGVPSWQEARLARKPIPWRRAGRLGWYATVNGRQIMLGLTEEAAWQALRAILATRGVDSPCVTVGAVLDDYVTAVEARVGRGEGSATTAKMRRGTSRRLGSLAGVSVVDLRPHHVLTWLAEKPYAPATRRVMVATVKAGLNHGVQVGLIGSNPLAGFRVPRAVPRRRPIPSDADLERVCARASPRAAEVFRFLAATGCRPGEARSICASHIEGDRVVLPDWKCARVKGEPRVIYLREPWPARLAELGKVMSSGPLFRRPDGQPWGETCLSVAWRYAASRAGVRCHLYSLRHRSITRALVAGVPVPTVAALHGTSIGEIQRTYSHVTSQADHLRESLRRWAG